MITLEKSSSCNSPKKRDCLDLKKEKTRQRKTKEMWQTKVMHESWSDCRLGKRRCYKKYLWDIRDILIQTEN